MTRSRSYSPNAQSEIHIFSASERLNQLLIRHLEPVVWTAKPAGNIRTIAAIFTHMHNVRTKWIRLTAPDLTIPAQLNRTHCTPSDASKALAESASRCEEMLAGVHSGRIKEFVRDGWARPWAASPLLFARTLSYILAHEAHHRGQVSLLAHQFGYPLSNAVISEMWNWEKHWK